MEGNEDFDHTRRTTAGRDETTNEIDSTDTRKKRKKKLKKRKRK